jgi:hypothetical protein
MRMRIKAERTQRLTVRMGRNLPCSVYATFKSGRIYLMGAILFAISPMMTSAQTIDCQDPANLANDECLGVPPDPALGNPTNLIPLLTPLVGFALAGALAGTGGTSTPSTTNQ